MTIEWLGRCVVTMADVVGVGVGVVVVDVTSFSCIRSISGLVIASNKNDNRKSTQ